MLRATITVILATCAIACSVPAFTEADQSAPDAGPGGQPQDAGGDSNSTRQHDASNDSQRVDANIDAPAPECTCVNDLSNVGLGDFVIALDVRTTMRPTSPGYGAMLDQRKTCDASNPGWDLWMNPTGTITFQLYDGSNVFANVNDGPAINDGAQHHITIERRGTGTQLSIYIDRNGTAYPPQTPESIDGQLAPLEQGADPTCASNGAAPAQPFVGTISNVCITIGCVPQ